MDRDEVERLLRGGPEGISEWNQRRQHEDRRRTTRVFLGGADLRGADLGGAVLRGADLRGAIIDEGTRLDAKWRLVWEIVNKPVAGRDLRGADLTGADLTGADLTGADLGGAVLRGADPRGAIIDERTRLDAKWRLVWEIVNKPVAGRDLRGADLTGADLRGADLRGADLDGAVLRGADLRGAVLRGADLRGAIIDERTTLDAKWRLVWEIVNKPVAGRDLHGADLGGTNLGGTVLRGAVLGGADLTGADLGGTDLRGADLTGADLTGADLTGADLTRARLIRCDLTYAAVENARVTDVQVHELRGIPKPPTVLRLGDDEEPLTGEEARTFFTLPAIVEVFLTESLSQFEIGCYHFHIGELHLHQVAIGVYFIGLRHEGGGSVLRFQGEDYEAIYKVLPDLLAPFPNARAVDWQKSIANVPKEKRGELINALMKMETRTAKGRWQFAERMAEVFKGYKDARIDGIAQGAKRAIGIVLFTDEQIAKELSARQALGSVDVTIYNEGIITGPVEKLHTGDKTKANIGGDATNVAIGQRASAKAGDINVFKQGVDQSLGLDPDLKQRLKEARETIEASGVPQKDKDDAAARLGESQGRAGTAESRQGANPALSGVAEGHRAERRGNPLLGGQDRRAVQGLTRAEVVVFLRAGQVTRTEARAPWKYRGFEGRELMTTRLYHSWQSGRCGRAGPRAILTATGASDRLGVAAPSLRKPTVAYWAQCRGSGPPERRGPFHPFDSPRMRYLAQCGPQGSDPVSLRTIRRLGGEHCAHCELDAIILRNISGCPTDSALLVDVVSPD